MHKELLISLIIIVVLFGGAMFFINRPPSVESGAQIIANTDQSKTIELKEINDSFQEGRAVISDSNGKTRILIKALSWTESQPISINEGTCQNLGAVKYQLSPLKKDVSLTILEIPFAELMNEAPWAIHLYQSESQPDISFACGDI